MPSYKDCVSGSSSVPSTTELIHLVGRVKWFKSGHGFISVTDGERAGDEVFVHHNAIQAPDMYRYLVQGEYVEFDLVKHPEGDKHAFHAENVTGVNQGKLLCVSRHEERQKGDGQPRRKREQPSTDNDNVPLPKQRKPREDKPPRETTEKKSRTNDKLVEQLVATHMEVERLATALGSVNWHTWLTQNPSAVELMSAKSRGRLSSLLGVVNIVAPSEIYTETSWTPVDRRGKPRKTKTVA